MTRLDAPAAILRRLGFAAPPPATGRGLAELARAHRRAFPFENLDVLAGMPPSTDLDATVDKIVSGGRGGWCMELNALLQATVEAAGFDYRLRLARVGYRRPAFGPLTHVLLAVRVGGREWLVDVGFGGPGPDGPLPLAAGEHRDAAGARFRIEAGRPDEFTLLREIDARWEVLYRLEAIQALPVDIIVAGHFLSTWPESPFRRMLMCAAHDSEGTWSSEGRELVRRDRHWQERERMPLADANALQQALENRLRVRAPLPLVRRAWRALG